MRSVDEVVDDIAARPTIAQTQVTFEQFQDLYTGYFRSMDQLAQLLITGIWHDPNGDHDQLWVDVLQRLINAGTRFVPASNDVLVKARLLPALITLSAAGVTATRRDRDALLIRLATEVEAVVRVGADVPSSAAQIVHYARLWSPDWINGLPLWEKAQWNYPASHLMVTDLRAYFVDTIPVDEDFVTAYHGFEYRIGLVQTHTTGHPAIEGEYVANEQWERDGDIPKAETAFRRQLERNRSDAWLGYYGGADELESALVAQREILKAYRRW